MNQIMTPTMSRRAMLSNGGKAALAGAALSTIALAEGCSVDQWLQTALNDLPTVVQLVTSILGIVNAANGGVVPANVLSEVNEYAGKAKASLLEAQQAVSDYKTAASTARPGYLGAIDAALTTAQENLNSILGIFAVTDPVLQTTIAASIGSALTVVLAIEALIPPPPAPTPTPAQLRHVKLHAAAQKKNADGNEVIKAAFNAIVGKAYPHAVLS